MQIRLHLHDEVRLDLDHRGIDLKEYIRDRLMRSLRSRFDAIPWFFFVIEDLTKTGLTRVRPHIHGSIQIPRVPLPLTANGVVKIRYRRVMARSNQIDAEYALGEDLLNDALRAATGNDGSRSAVVNGIRQGSNMWTRTPYRALFNDEWVSYAFKNMAKFSRRLPENRLSMCRALNQEAQRLWNLIREGEPALDQWKP